MSLLHRIAEQSRQRVRFLIDGKPAEALAGDTVLTALLLQSDALGHSDLEGRPRAGFCLMGACQDCWVTTDSGERFRACTTMIAEGMAIWTGRP